MRIHHVPIFISAAIAVLTASLLLVSCTPLGDAQDGNVDAVAFWDADALSGTVFFGESTTAHLARRGGVLDTAQGRRMVWRDDSGTRMLDRRILSSTVEYIGQDGNTRSIPLSEAIAREMPARMVLSFGLNGIVSFSQDPNTFIAAYRSLIESIHALSPMTLVVLQSIYPVRSATGFSLDTATLNQKIALLNTHVAALAATFSYVSYADTASILRDADGLLAARYDNGDGIHLTNEAYGQILGYLLTHVAACADAYITK